MAQQTKNTSKNTDKKRGPGRPPGSKNKPKTTSSSSGNPTRQEVLDEMKRRSDRDKRNNDVIWSITLFAIGLFLLFTVVMDSTGSFGKAVHDLCNGLFGLMAYVLPFLVFIFAALLLFGKVRHISASTGIFSVLIFVNMCILNSSRFIDIQNLKYGFKDIANFYLYGVNGVNGGVIGMEFGSLLAHFFGMPGLFIISIAVLIISVFLVANTPISRFAGKITNKFEQNRMLKELEEDERRSLTDEQIKAAIAADPSISADTHSEKKPFWKSVISGIIREEPEEEVHHNTDAPQASATDIPKPFGSRGTLFGKVKDYISGIDSETGDRVNTDSIKYIDDPGVLGKDASKNPSNGIYNKDRNFDSEEDFGYPGKKRTATAKTRPGLGLGDPDDVGHSGSYGLDAHDKNGKPLKTAKTTSPTRGIVPASEQASAVMNPASASSPENLNKKSAAAKREEPVYEPDSAEDAAIAEGFNSIAVDTSYELPPVSLLKKDTGSKQIMSDLQLQERAELLEQTLNNFGVEATVLKVTQGASVTRYEVQPATGVKVASITRLSDDIALNLRAKSIRIEAPIPGKAAVGIEVENDKPAPVLIRDLIDSDEFREASSVIEFVVGKDISGNNIVADLKDMPHLLIAGATGSGKSVCINSIITSFLYKARPSELKLIMIDPKVVELGNYNGIPHMLTPVVTDPRKASRALAIAVEEMDKRYELFAEHNVKDLNSYNELMRVDGRYADCKPQIVIIIDELADLMMASPSEVENSICRLAQKARAAGMHLIVATQRPSVDVVTGLIKANIPSRIAFSVASQFDSRTILDMAGAEKLLGKGDMLFSPVGSTKPYRVQGPYISEKEIDKIIKFVKKEGGSPAYDEELKTAIENADKKSSKEPQDELTEDAIAFIFKSKQASVSMLQRRFRIGYNRAARIIDEIEEKGIIGPSDGSRPRQLLITEEEYYGGYEEEQTPEPAEPETADAVASPVESKLSQTQAMDSFNSLPESVRRMVMDADSESDY